MKKLKLMGALFLSLCVLVIAGCSGGGDDGSGYQSTGGIALIPGGIAPTGPTTVSFLDVTATKLVLLTNGTDSITFTLAAKDQGRVAVQDETILVSSTGGTLTASSVKTDADGLATVDLQVGTEKTNRQITVTFSAGGLIVTQSVTISGTTLALAASKLTTTPSDPAPIEFTTTLKDAGGNPVTAQVAFTSTLNNSFTSSPGYTLGAGNTGTTANGIFKVKYVGTNVGNATVTATASGVTASTDVTIEPQSLAFFGFTSPADNSVVNVGSTQTLTVQYLDAVGAGVSDTLIFSTGKGYFGGDPNAKSVSVATVGGIATVDFQTDNISGPAEIKVFDSTLTRSDTLFLDVRSTIAASILLQASPTVVPVNIGGAVATSTLTATVADANNQAVAGKMVTFSITSELPDKIPPGGGEFISPITAITDAGGNATAIFTSGTKVSAKDAVVVQASVDDGSGNLLFDRTYLTIGQKAATITIGASNKISPVTVNGVEVGYALPFSVLVNDSNGNPINGAVVSLGLFPLRFYTGGLAMPPVNPGDPPEGDQIRDGIFLNEDTNRNSILDPGEDGAPGLDVLTMTLDGTYWVSGDEDLFAVISNTQTGNGKLDPGGVATIPLSVTTGDLGIAGFVVTYPKAFGGWVEVEITASTEVTGSTSVAKRVAMLAVQEGDKPYPPSPFGIYPPSILP